MTSEPAVGDGANGAANRAANRAANGADEAFVWVWLPGATEPVVAGLLSRFNGGLAFNYGRSYLAREGAISLYEPELPLRTGLLRPAPGLSMPSCIRDAAPDAWGRRVIINRRYGQRRDDIDVGQLDELDFLLASGSDRTGALDFQRSSTVFEPRGGGEAPLEELIDAARRVEEGLPLTPGLDQALLHGSSVGGARPKTLIVHGGRKFIAKFSSQADVFNVVKGEYVAMRLADRVGLNAAPVKLERAAGKDVLLVERFDRVWTPKGWTRRGMVSALTLFGLDEMMARYASYEDLCEIVRRRFTDPLLTLRELFGRLVFNILVGNTDDHARNHAAFWDGRMLSLTPAYDICPQARAGGEATQAMLIAGEDRMSRLSSCRRAARAFRLREEEADAVIVRLVEGIKAAWPAVCEEAGLGVVERDAMWRRQVLNPFAFEGLPEAMAGLAN